MSRDLDSHFGEREQAAVEEWLRQSFAILSLLYIIDAVTFSGIEFWKQKIGATFNFCKQDVINFTKFSKFTMCRASEA
jgi:hypothetical protein